LDQKKLQTKFAWYLERRMALETDYSYLAVVVRYEGQFQFLKQNFIFFFRSNNSSIADQYESSDHKLHTIVMNRSYDTGA
jgi:hypothetical protein